jgi:uncharacterized protein (TIGR00251 family)
VALSGGFVHTHALGVVVAVWVVPSASRSGVDGLHSGLLRVRVTEPPEGGRANKAAARVLAEFFGVRRGLVIAGAASRQKRVLMFGLTIAEARLRLECLPGAPPD